MAKGFDVILKDNSKEILEELESKKDIILEEWGLTAERFAKLGCTVDTGRLRNSISHVTTKVNTGGHYTWNAVGEKSGRKVKVTEGDSTLSETPDNDTVIIGTNVEYAPYIEKGRKPFLKPAIQDHMEDYKKIAENHLKY